MGFGLAIQLASRAKAGGGRRTRTFEVIRRLIYSQLPLPLGTLPRSTASQPIRRNGGNSARDDVKTGCRWRAAGWRVYEGIAPAKSTKAGMNIRRFRSPKLPFCGTRETSAA